MARGPKESLLKLSEELCLEFRENGAVKLEGLLDGYWLDRCRENFDWSYANPSPNAAKAFLSDRKDPTSSNYFNDLTSIGTPQEAEKLERFRELFTNGPFAQASAQLMGSEKVWFYDHELFLKTQDRVTKEGQIGRTRAPFHQDTPYLSYVGPDQIGFWICLEDKEVPKGSALEVVKGSHKGLMYDIPIYHPKDDQKGYFQDRGRYVLPQVPAVEDLRNKGEMEVLSWGLKPGDVIAFNTHALHGGAGLTPDQPYRRTLTLRFFGEKLYYKELPMKPFGTPMPWLETLTDGEPFWRARRTAGQGGQEGGAAEKNNEYQFVQVLGDPPTSDDLPPRTFTSGPVAAGSGFAHAAKL